MDMEKVYTSTQRFIRISPKKVRVVVQSIKKMSPEKAVEVLPYLPKSASIPLQKTIKSAIANASMQGAKVSELEFKEIQIGQGPTLKRGIPAPKGRYHPIMKRMSHIRVVLVARKQEIKEETKPVEKKGTNGAKS
ncbi:hypothetical protein BH10PAT1_BH10PAT1_5170 [soil metagenome]